MRHVYKPDAVWHNFKPSDFPTMALGGRLDHPTRAHFYAWLAQQARQSKPAMRWCDVGVLSMVDYLNVRRGFAAGLSTRIVYCGLEIGASIAEVARKQLLRPDDCIVVGDLEDPRLPGSMSDRFDVVSIRHVLNHCAYYEVPLRNAFELLNPGGKVFVNLHLKCSSDGDRLQERPLPGVEGAYLENVYEFRRFLRYFTSLFALEAVLEIDSRLDGRHKPNQIFIGIKPGDPERVRPDVITVVPSGATRLIKFLRSRFVRLVRATGTAPGGELGAGPGTRDEHAVSPTGVSRAARKGLPEVLVDRLPKYGRAFVLLGAFFERWFRKFDERRLRTFVGARTIPPLPLRAGGHQAYADWCFQAGVYAGLLGALGRSTLRVLDVGCGAGELVPGILQVMSADSTYLGVDIDALMIRGCQQLFTDPRARFLVVDGDSPFYPVIRGETARGLAEICGATQWDVIIAKALLDHLSPDDVERHLRQFSRSLADDGVVIATLFVLDADHRAGRERLGRRFRFDDRHPARPGFRYCASFNSVPEAQLAIEDGQLDQLLAASNLRIERMLPGTWRDPDGRRGVDMPDTLVLVRRG